MTAAKGEQIIDAALTLATDSSWESVRLNQVAAHLGITLNEVRRHFAEKEDLVNAFFDRADAAMLDHAESAGFSDWPPRERLQCLLLVWFDALAPWRRVAREMIVGKLEPGHLHVQIPGLLRVSRTVQWWREAAGLEATHLRRALEETVLSSIYLSSFTCWLNDESADAAVTRRHVHRALGMAEAAALWLDGRTDGATPRA